MRMYDHLGIPYHPIRFLFSFAKASSSPPANPQGQGAPGRAPGEYFVHASNLHQIPPWPGSRGVLAHLFWFTVACFLVRPHGERAGGGGETLDAYVGRIWLPRRYVTHYLLPLMSSVSTCSHDEMLAFPASDVVNYKRLTHGQQHYTVCGGVHQVEGRLAAGMRDVRLGARVAEVAPTSDGTVRIRWQSTTSSGLEPLQEDVFDRVILAVSPDIAGKIFSPLQTTLGSIPTTRVESSVLRPANSTPSQQPLTLVEDESSHPKACSLHRGSAIPQQVICLRTDFAAAAAAVAGEVRTEALHTMPGGTVVSTCPLDPQAEAKRVLRTARFTRTLRTTESRAAIRRIMGETGRGSDKKTDPVRDAGDFWVNGQDNVWLTGAWCWDGMVLLEGCLVSAMRIANDFGVEVPWTR
ncbi:hypothetical protein CTA2_210 [Colletotrichum tanaceti]|nr:hypothetical protein CTA2_210 [Colletotrichum tanaceti]